jgi:hypothetical protein
MKRIIQLWNDLTYPFRAIQECGSGSMSSLCNGAHKASRGGKKGRDLNSPPNLGRTRSLRILLTKPSIITRAVDCD